MKLTAKQEAFAQAVADGGTQSDAYRAAYSCGNMTDKQINEEACKQAKHPKIAQRVTELRQALADRALWTREDSVRELRGIATNSQEPTAARVSSIKELNEMHGYHEPKKLEAEFTGLDVVIKHR